MSFVMNGSNGRHVVFLVLLGDVVACFGQNIAVVGKVRIPADVMFCDWRVGAKSDMSKPV